MSDIDDLDKKYQKGSKAKEIRDSISKLKETPSNPDTKRAFESRKETLESIIKAAKQATAGFKSQWSGLDDEGKVGVGKGTPGIYYNTVAIPAIAGIVDEKYAPDFAVAADKKAGKIKEAVRKDMGIEEPKGALEHFAYAGGEMLGQLPVPGALMNKIVGGAKKMGLAGKVAAAPVEYLSPTIDPKAINYGIGTAFGGGLGVVGEALGEPDHKALGGLIQKYENGGKVGRFFSAVNKAIETLKQKKGTGEQILKQLESTPGVKQEELETRGIKQKLQASPKITQEELQKVAARNKAPIPERTVLGAGVPEDYRPEIPANYQKVLDQYGFEPVINPNDRGVMGFRDDERGEIVPFDVISGMHPEELGFPVNSQGKMDPEVAGEYKDLMKSLMYVEKKFAADLPKYDTKFQSYSQPGGENYREVLLHLPQADVQAKNLKQTELHDLLSQDVSGMTEDEARKMNERINQLINEVTIQGEGFRSSHYDTPNILTHFRISDRKGPSGEKVLYVDEIQSDWHQKARDARKDYIKGQLTKERSDIQKQAVAELKAAGNDLKVSPENERELQRIVNRLTKERKAELEKAVPKDFGYRRPEDVEKLTELHTKIDRIRNNGLTPEETKEYFTPGRIVPVYDGQDKVLSFNGGESSLRYKETYEKKLAQAVSAGVDEKTAADWAAKRATNETKYDWSVTVIEVDPKTGEPRNGAQPRTHNTSPANEVKDALIKEAHTYDRKVPDAPFKDNWHELATKEILDMAAKEGYDKVAFSPGMEQINRYSSQLRQALDSITYTPQGDGSLLIQGVKDGRNIFEGQVIDGQFTTGPGEGKSLSDLFGGEIAKKIEGASASRGQPGRIEGENLTVGGEGMKSFYDKRVPDYVRKYGGKEFDAKSDYTDITMTEPNTKKPTDSDIQRKMREIADADDDELMERVHDITNQMADRALMDRGIRPGTPDYEDRFWDAVDEFQESGADQALRDLAVERLNKGEPGKTLRAFTVDVTPKMKEKITTEGQKLFAATPAIGLGAGQVQQPVQEELKEQPPVQSDEPQVGYTVPFQSGGRVGALNKAATLIGSRLKSSKPLEIEGFHGSKSTGIDKFKKSNPAASEGLADSEIGALWITPNRELAEQYASGKTMDNQFPSKKGGEVYELLASLKNPLVLWDDNYLPWNKNQAANINSPYTRKFALEYAKNNGHDSVVFANKSGKKREVSNFQVAILPDEQGEYQGISKKALSNDEDEPQGFQSGGRVGKTKDAAETLLRVLHGSPTKVMLEKGKNLDVTTDPGYAVKRAGDKMSMMGLEGPPMVNKFDVPASKMLRFEETYSPEDVKLMRRFFNKLPEGKAMTGEEIYDATGGKDFVLEGLAKAGGFAGYERPAGGSGGVGNWYRVTDQEALTRKARGGLAQLRRRA